MKIRTMTWSWNKCSDIACKDRRTKVSSQYPIPIKTSSRFLCKQLLFLKIVDNEFIFNSCGRVRYPLSRFSSPFFLVSQQTKFKDTGSECKNKLRLRQRPAFHQSLTSNLLIRNRPIIAQCLTVFALWINHVYVQYFMRKLLRIICYYHSFFSWFL